MIASPTIFSIAGAGVSNFRGIYPTLAKDEVHYLAMTKEVAEGHGLANAFLKEHKNDPYLQPPLAEFIMARTAGLLGFSVPKLFFINDLILPFLGVILLYALLFGVTGSKTISYFFSFFYYLIYLGGFGRPINQQFSILFVFAGLILIWKIFSGISTTKRRIILNGSLGLAVGALVYIYPYYWTTLAAVYVLSQLFRVVKERNIRNVAIDSISFFAAALAATIPYLINLRVALASPFYEEATLRMGMISTHWPGAFVKVGLVIIAGLVLYITNKKNIRPAAINFSYIMLFSAIVLNWQNLITGKYLQFSSHYNTVSFLIVLLVLAVMISGLDRRVLDRTDKRQLGQFLLVTFFTLSVFSYLIYSQRIEIISFRARWTPEKLNELEKSRDLFDWFNTETAKDSSVYYIGGDSIKEMNFTIYSDNNLYYQPYAAHYLMSDDELENRWLISKYFTEKVDAEYVRSNNRGIWMNKFVDVNQNQGIRNKIIGTILRRPYSMPEMMPTDNYVDRVLKKNDALKKDKIEKVLGMYDLDYIVLDLSVDKYKDLEKKFEKFKFMAPVWRIGNDLIYKVSL
jgi:hypothetical protein